MKIIKRIGVSLIALVLILANTPLAFANTTQSQNEKITEVAKKLRDQHKAQSRSKGLYVDPSIDTTANETIKVIVEMDVEPVAIQRSLQMKAHNGKEAKQKVKKNHDKVKNHLKQKKIKHKIRASYEEIFNGISMEIKASDIPKLLESENIIAVYKNHEVEAIPVDLETETKPYMDTTLPFLGIDQIWETGFDGKGIKVGVIDTGIDYNHPDLKTAYKGGYDFVDKDADPYEGNELIPTTHGTHVAGTIAARGNPKQGRVKGVAPRAEIYAYRVLAPYGGWDDWVVSGIEQAVKDGMDIINLSLGASVNNSDTATARAVNNAMLAGVIPVIANGNTGLGRTLGTVSTPAAAALPISVGATYPPFKAFMFEGTTPLMAEKTFSLNWLMDWKPNDIKALFRDTEMVYLGLGTEKDFAGANIKGKIALVKRGVMFFEDINKLAKEGGAKAVIIFNADGINEHINSPYPVSGELPMFDMRGDEGRALAAIYLNKDFKKKDYMNATFKMTGMAEDIYPGDDIVDFSSNGPVQDSWDIKPDVVAPGASIYSTVPAFGGSYKEAYARYSGTSMATPHVAGIIALLKQAYPSYNAFEIKSLIMNTSLKLGTSVFNGEQYGVLEMGAGRVQPLDALNSPVIAEVLDTAAYTKAPFGEKAPETVEFRTGSLNFGEIWEGNEWTKTIILKNKGNTNISYDLSYEIRHFSKDSGGVIGFSEASSAQTTDAHLSLSKNKVTIPANGEMGIVRTLSEEELTPGEHRFTWDGTFTPINDDGSLGKPKMAESSLYFIDLYTIDKYGNDHYVDFNTIISHEKTDVIVKHATEDNKIHVTENKITGSLTGSPIVYLAKDLYFNDLDFSNMLQLSYEVKQKGEVVDSGWVDLWMNETTHPDHFDFTIEGKFPTGESTLILKAIDKAGNENLETYQVHYDVGMTINALDAELGKEYKITVDGNQLTSFQNGEFSLKYDPTIFTFDRVEATEELLKAFPGATVEASSSSSNNQIVVKINGNDNTSQGINDKASLVNVYFQTTPFVEGLGNSAFQISAAKYVSATLGEITLDEYSKQVEVYTAPTSFTTSLFLEAFLDRSGKPRTDIKYGMPGTEVIIYDSVTGERLLPLDGYRSDVYADIENDGAIGIHGLKPGKEYDFEVVFKGHISGWFKGIKTYTLDANGNKLPIKEMQLDPVLQKAGDANGDNKINFYDISLANRYMGEKAVDGSYQNWMASWADINQDGELTETDLSFMKKNEGSVGEIKDTYIGNSQALLSLSANTTTLNGDEVFEVNMNIENGSNLYALETALEYDPAVLELVSIEGDSSLAGKPGDYFDAAIAPVDFIKNKSNGAKVIFAASYKGEVAEVAKASGTVVTYYFKWKDANVSSTLLQPSMLVVDQYMYLGHGQAETFDLVKN